MKIPIRGPTPSDRFERERKSDGKVLEKGERSVHTQLELVTHTSRKGRLRSRILARKKVINIPMYAFLGKRRKGIKAQRRIGPSWAIFQRHAGAGEHALLKNVTRAVPS